MRGLTYLRNTRARKVRYPNDGKGGYIAKKVDYWGDTISINVSKPLIYMDIMRKYGALYRHRTPIS